MDVAVIGGGIVGLAHAWSAAKRRHRVTLYERNSAARSASIRNFGMIWPIGQPAGELRSIALRSRNLWLELGRTADVWVRECGSIHLAHREDEWAVLQEFFQAAGAGIAECELLAREQVLDRTPAANPNGLIGGLFSTAELCVNPRTANRRITSWLASAHGVRFEFDTAVTQVEGNRVISSAGRAENFPKVVICSGADLQTLYPEVFRGSGLKLCKLQMLQAGGQPSGWQLGPHLASGLTLRHYGNFAVCKSLAGLKQRVAADTPELDQFGIHVMASQNDAGQVILGDSHEYDAAIEPFDKSRIDDLMLRELRRVISLPDWSITERWHGIYAKHPNQAWFDAEPTPGVHICTGLGGAGMTMSLGLAEHLWEQWT